MILLDLLFKVHPVIIHFVIAGFTLSTLCAVIGLLLSKFREWQFVSVIESFGVVNFFVATAFYPLVVIAGIIDGHSLQKVISRDLLAIKVVLGLFTIVTIILLLSMFIISHRRNFTIFEHKPLYFAYALISLINWGFILLTAALGGLYVFGHTVFENVGLGFLIPTSINQPTNDLFPYAWQAVFFSPVMTIPLVLLLFLGILILFRASRHLSQEVFF